ncbi:hypothetical protein FisN_2Hu387 [Fistulifera solaris]|uniref:Uncharacterized protein n=1 Tax=Fistulifera solaris TaxID=1519565 RepID=A0A1Z5KK42_FISSO|nr:hypothetical protein FisN_2Hu387 [Fistulifera solaris]|eukprot:GAX26673.1 hypothetical protein FisN_2Hu387 [Fistulifera solaris]
MNGPLLELISKENMTPRQKALLPAIYRGRLPMYRLLREPTHLDEFDWENNQNAMLWFENGSLLCWYRAASFFEEHDYCFMISDADESSHKFFLECAVHGESEAKILETVTFLWSLQQLEGSRTRLTVSQSSVDDADYEFNFATLQPEQLARILDANPSRRFFFSQGLWSPEQAVVLTSRPNTTDLCIIDGCFENVAFAFEDDGTAFVRELEKRKSSFGTLCIDVDEGKIPFSRTNFRRLFELDVIDKLEIGILVKELVLLPFSAKAKAVSYKIRSDSMQPTEFEALEIVPKDLHIKFYVDAADKEWDALPIAFLNRVTALGDFEKLSFLIFRRGQGRQRFHAKKVEQVAKALLRAINANPNLQYLNVGSTLYEDPKSCLHWDVQPLFNAVAAHPGIKTLVVGDYPSGNDPANYSLLEALLSRNRNLVVLDRKCNRISNGTSVDKLYALNAFYNGSAAFGKEAATLRQSLVGTTMVESASRNFQYTSLLLSKNTDVLYDLMQCLNLEDLVALSEQTEVLAAISREPTERKTKKTRTGKESA